MTDRSNARNLPSLHSSTSGALSPLNLRPDHLAPSPVTDAVALLTSCLALVKPVGMSGEDAHAWLRVAAGEVAHLPRDILAAACGEARKVCTHHGQIIPAIIKEGDERLNTRRKIVQPMPIPPERHLEHQRWSPTRDELEALKAATTKGLRASG